MKGLTADCEIYFYLLELEKKRIEEEYAPKIAGQKESNKFAKEELKSINNFVV
jgi:hypothetical protein